jgi:uncharacterized protein YcaQ
VSPTDSVSLTWDRVRTWRLAHQRLLQRVQSARLLDVVRDVGGIHAQVQSSAELQLWARVNGVSRDDIREALWEKRSLVRTWCMRGTLHLLPAAELPTYVAALRTHDRWWKGAWLRMIGMTEKELRDTLAAIRASLTARPITREQLAHKVAGRVGLKGRERMLSGWAEMLKPAAFEGALISGPPRGQSVTFVRPDRWLKKWEEPSNEEAWRVIVRRYLHAYGPATREEFARWWGMQPAPAGRILNASEHELSEVDIEGHRALALAGDVKKIRGGARHDSVRLLPAFDVYIVGTRPKESLVQKPREDRVFRKAGWISPVVLVNGVVEGVWEHERVKNRLSLTVQPFGRLAAEERKQIAAEADRLGRFLDTPASVAYTPFK